MLGAKKNPKQAKPNKTKPKANKKPPHPTKQRKHQAKPNPSPPPKKGDLSPMIDWLLTLEVCHNYKEATSHHQKEPTKTTSGFICCFKEVSTAKDKKSSKY